MYSFARLVLQVLDRQLYVHSKTCLAMTSQQEATYRAVGARAAGATVARARGSASTVSHGDRRGFWQLVKDLGRESDLQFLKRRLVLLKAWI